MPHGYTKEELDLLSDDEREGLLSQEQDDINELEDDGQAAKAAKADDDDDGDGKPAAKQDQADKTKPEDVPGEQVEPAAAAAAAAAAAEDAAAADPVVEAEIVPEPAKYVLPPADLDTKITSVRDEQLVLATKFDEGDLSAQDYQKQNRALDDQIATLRETKLKATMSFDAKVDEWLNVTAPAWLDKHEHYRTNPALFEQLNEQVKKLQETTFQPNIFDARIMDVAHARLTETFRQMGLNAPGAAPAKDKAGRVIPPNIGGLPQAGEDDLNDGGAFAALDRLMDSDYLAWEGKLQSMSEADRDTYLATR